ncbi:SPFH domain-containing protein [Candidatus Leptofilum sp.]|uniref:SPFH domain-containing protein n=1 Tax=Candidatus Leptofilum sp. TaxID=3241576 RepID=UPI003B5AA6C0
MSVQSQRPFSRLNRRPLVNTWYPYFLGFMLLMFWGYAWYIERVEVVKVIEWLNNQSLGALATLPYVPQILGFFHWKVLRHVVAVAVGYFFARDAAIMLVKILYDLPDRAGASRFLNRLLNAGFGTVKPPEITPAMLANERNDSVLLRVGGPGQVKVPTGHVMVTEFNGRFHRILAAGIHKLERYEYIHAVINLQPQQRMLDEFAAYSRDGLELRVGLSIVYRIKLGSEPTTRENPYPYDETAVRTAAYVQTVVDDKGIVTTWEDTPLNMAKGTLTAILAGFRLDEIMTPATPGEEPYRTLRNELLRQLRLKLDGMGIDLQAVGIHRIDLPDGVTAQYIDYWKSHWESQMLLNVTEGRATAEEKMEVAKAEAEIMMIQAIQEGIQRAKREGATAHMEELVALRLVEALEQMARRSESLTPLPNALMAQLDNMRRQLSDGNYNPRLPGKPIV